MEYIRCTWQNKMASDIENFLLCKNWSSVFRCVKKACACAEISISKRFLGPVFKFSSPGCTTSNGRFISKEKFEFWDVITNIYGIHLYVIATIISPVREDNHISIFVTYLFCKKVTLEIRGKSYFSHKCHTRCQLFPGGSLWVECMDRGVSLR